MNNGRETGKKNEIRLKKMLYIFNVIENKIKLWILTITKNLEWKIKQNNKKLKMEIEMTKIIVKYVMFGQHEK